MLDEKKVLNALWNYMNVPYEDVLSMQTFALQRFDGFLSFSNYLNPLTFGIEFERLIFELRHDFVEDGKVVTREVFETVVNKYFGEDVLDVCRKDDVA